MDLLIVDVAILLLFSAGSGASGVNGPKLGGDRVFLPEGPVLGILGKSATLKTLRHKFNDSYLAWVYSRGSLVFPVASMSRGMLSIRKSYEGRATMDAANGDLILKSLKLTDNGDYTITVRTVDGRILHHRELIELRVLESISGAKIRGPTSPPIAGTSSANLSCQAMAGTVATTAWLKDDVPLTAGGERLVFSEDQSLLMIHLLQKEDSGEYKCQLTNPVSSDHASFLLLVNFGPEEPTVTGPHSIERNHPLTLTCSAPSGPPANFTWKFNGRTTHVRTERFVIKALALGDAGTYRCEAYNAVTGRRTTVDHVVSVTVYGDSLVACAALLVLLVSGYVVLAARCLRERRRSRRSDAQVDVGEADQSEDSLYQSLSPIREEPLYCSLTDK